MQENVVKLDPRPEFAIGRESEDMCLLARFFNGFANSTGSPYCCYWRIGAR